MRSILIILAFIFGIHNLSGQTAKEYFEQGVANYEKGKYLSATRVLTKAINLKPDYAEAYKVRGDAKVMNPNSTYNSAIDDYTKAIELDPNNAVAYGNRGFVKHIKRDYKGALEDYNKALIINPD
jgi:tetratricopeptide (TPR) repeat protein